MNRKAVAISNILMSLIFSFVFTLTGQYLGNGKILWSGFPVPYLLGAVIGFLVVQFVPCAKWGAGLGTRLGAKPGTFAFECCINLVISAVMSVILTMIMTVFSMSVMGGAPVGMAALTGLKAIPLYIAIAFVIGLAVNGPVKKLAAWLAGK